MGIDIGSAASKVAVLRDGTELVAGAVVPAGTGTSGPDRALAQALAEAGLALEDMARIVATGYGRFTSKVTQQQVSELSCHARGIAHLLPSARTVIDIGGQDVKAIKLDAQGLVTQFLMNDKCAAGTGRFLEVMSRVLEIPLEEMGAAHDRAQNPVSVSSTCTVFAESEVISQLSAGVPREDIVVGVHRAVADKACGLARRAGVEEDVVLSGGVAQNSGVVKALSQELGLTVLVAPRSQLVGALGAALSAWDTLQREKERS